MKIQLLTGTENSPYLLEDRREIQRILRGIMQSRSIVALFSRPDRDPALSSLVDLDPDRRILYFERSPSALAESLILASPEVTCATLHEQVHIQFACGKAREGKHQGVTCVLLDYPSQMLRMQRREYYRLPTSVLNPVKCMINTEHGLLETVVVDISVGGVGILAFGEGPELQPGNTYHGSRLALPKAGDYAVSLEVCSTYEVTLKNGNVSHRAGCRFIDLPASIETEIQRYIIRTDRERRTRYI